MFSLLICYELFRLIWHYFFESKPGKKSKSTLGIFFFVLLWEENFGPFFKFYFLHLVLPRGTRFEAKFFSSLRLMPKFLKLFFCCCCFREVLQFFNLCFPQKVPLVQKSQVPFKFFFLFAFLLRNSDLKKNFVLSF